MADDPGPIPRVLFVTGRLAEPSLRRVVAELTSKVAIQADVAVLPITVAALLTTQWVGTHLRVEPGIERIILPGYCRGEVEPLAQQFGMPVELGPRDLRDLPEQFGRGEKPPPNLERYDIEILAEINFAPHLSTDEIMTLARRYRSDGADVIDIGCDPGQPWSGVGDIVRRLVGEGFRVSIDSMNATEIAAAAKAGAELALSVNSSNVAAAPDWGIEVVVIPDDPATLAGFDANIETLAVQGVPLRLDPVLEPIGFGFAQSLGRYLAVRERYPDAAMMMGVGNLTELTDVDSAGVNVLLAGFCQELGIHSVLTTEVINWCRSCVRELDLARRLVGHAVRERLLPKKLSRDLVCLRDPKVTEQGEAALAELAERITDRNYRLFAERGELHVINGAMHLHGTDPFALFAEIARRDSAMDADHAFYIGFELAKALTALTLGKTYTQDQALNWGHLTRPENDHRG